MTAWCRNIGLFTCGMELFTVVVVCLRIGFIKGNSVEVLMEPSGTFQSLGFPDLDDNKECTWKIILPQYHRIRLEFLHFDLLQIGFCNDIVEIYDGDTERSTTHRGTSLEGKSMASSSNVMTVVLKSCAVSLFWDREGIQVSYSSIYPTTTVHETSKRVITTPRVSTRAMSTETTTTNPISSKVPTITTTYTSVELSTGLHYSNNYSKQDSLVGSRSFLPVLLAGFLVSFLVLIIIAIVIVKRRKAKQSSNTTTTSTSNNDANNDHASSSNTITESTAVTNSLSEYNCLYGTDIRNMNENVHLEGSRVIFSSKMSSSRLKKKQPMFSRDDDTCVYENNANKIYSNTDFNEDYGAVSCTLQQVSHKAENSDGERQRKCLDVNSNEGVVINTVYEPYVPES